MFFKLARMNFRRICLKIPEKTTYLRTYVLVILVVLGGTTVIWDILDDMAKSRLIRCYASGGNLLPVLSDKEVTVGHDIFFLETTCKGIVNNKDIKLNARQACAVESAALHHPHHVVFLLVTAPVSTELNTSSNPVVRALLQYQNVRIRHIDVQQFIEDTPLEEIFGGPLRNSRYPISHASDILRYTTLLKYRGTYMDLDVIVLSNLLNTTNFVGAESPRSLGAGVINFGPDKVGKQMSSECAQELQNTFDGAQWGNNGPGVITRVLQRRCQVGNVSQMLSAKCQGFHILPVQSFYAVPFGEAKIFFHPGMLEDAQKRLNSSLVIHLWNKITGKFRPANDSDVPLLYYAERHCPKVFKYARGHL